MPAKSHSLHIEVTWRPRKTWRAITLLKRVAAYVAAAENFQTGRLSVVVLGSQAMKTLHKRYLDSSDVTDVLTFDLGTNRRQGVLDAEIALCADVALRRCQSVKNQPHALTAARAELTLYLTHGILHLAGYDDHSKTQYRRMHAREDELLTSLGFGPLFGLK